MGAIIGILSRLFSGGGLIFLALLGLLFGVLGDVLEFAFFTYGAIVWIMLIVALLPAIATLFEYIVYPLLWLNSVILGAEKPKRDFLRIEARIRLDSIKKHKREKLAE